MRIRNLLFFGILVFTFVFIGCRKERFYEGKDAKVTFSTDTVFFDTVFTSLGTATKRVMIRNPYNETLQLDQVWIAGGKDSPFRMNVDGRPGNNISAISIPPDDSIFVFVEATIDPTNGNLPFVVTDSLYTSTGGNLQKIKLVAWGQNAYYYRPSTVIQGLPAFSYLSEYGLTSLTETWKNDKPHVIYGYLMVDSLLTLRIEEGTQIHFHKGSGLWVYRGGKLEVKGTVDNPVVFQGDRLENSFDDNPGQWDRIWINAGTEDHLIEHAEIKNGFVGLQVEPYPFKRGIGRAPGKLTLKNTTIQNMVGVGVLARNTIIEGENTVIADCGTHNLALTGGGSYSFVHCSFPNYWTGSTRRDPLLLMTNYYDDLFGETNYFPMDKAYFGNCILYGSSDEEIGFDFDENTGFSYLFDHCILRTETNFDSTYITTIYTPAPNLTVDGSLINSIFTDVSEYDYTLHGNSVAIDKGDNAITGSISLDKAGKNRIYNGISDLGAFEYQPE